MCPAPPAGRWQLVVLLLAALVITLVFVALSPRYGITFDEGPRQANGERVLRFYDGSLSYDDFRKDRTGAHLYGALFDLTAAWLQRQLGADIWTIRHRLGAVFGGLGILLTGLLAVRLIGFTGALLAMTLLTLSPRYVGHSMNNPKDLPFAVLSTLALLSFTLLRAAPPFLTWPRAAACGLTLGLALGVRPGALLHAGYLGLLLLTLTLYARAWSPRTLLAVSGRLALALGVMLAVGSLFWPWAQLNPLTHPIRAFFEISHFTWPGHVLFAGRVFPAADVPWTYLPGWMLVTIPPVVLVGLVPAAFETLRQHGIACAWRAALWLIAATPIVAAIAAGSTLYDGWRHVLFVYPPLVVLAASGWHDFITRASPVPVVAGILVGAFAAGCLEPLLFMARNHPNEVVYFNRIVDGPRGAFGRYEMDYWGNSLLQATEWTARLAQRAGVGLTISGWPFPLVQADAKRFRNLDPQPPTLQRHHVYVELLRAAPDDLKAMLRRGDALHVVRMADGAPLALVLRGPRFGEVAETVVPYLRAGGP